MIGTAIQADWAERIKRQARAESDRVASALKSAAGNQADQNPMETLSVIAILEEKVMANAHAGYRIGAWRELRDQVRQMITQDSRYQIIRANRVAR